jgi:hypothetical protein
MPPLLEHTESENDEWSTTSHDATHQIFQQISCSSNEKQNNTDCLSLLDHDVVSWPRLGAVDAASWIDCDVASLCSSWIDVEEDFEKVEDDDVSSNVSFVVIEEVAARRSWAERAAAAAAASNAAGGPQKRIPPLVQQCPQQRRRDEKDE